MKNWIYFREELTTGDVVVNTLVDKYLEEQKLIKKNESNYEVYEYRSNDKDEKIMETLKYLIDLERNYYTISLSGNQNESIVLIVTSKNVIALLLDINNFDIYVTKLIYKSFDWTTTNVLEMEVLISKAINTLLNK